MKNIKKKVIITLLCLITLVTGGFFYFNSVFLPVHLKGIITNQTSKYLNRTVTLDSIIYNPMRGVTIKNLTLYSRTQEEPALIHIERATFQVLLPPILNNKKIIIPSLNIQKPTIRLIRNPDKVWNFSDLLQPRKAGKSKSPFNFFLGSILVENARVEITDAGSQPPFEESINVPTFKVNLSMEKGVKFQMDANIPQTNSLLNIQGSFSPLSKEIKCQISATSLPLSRYTPILFDSQTVQITQADIKDAELTLKWQGNKTDINGGFTIMADVSPRTDMIFKGLISANDFTLTKEEQRIYITSVLDVKDSQCVWSNERYFTGDINAQNLEVSFLDGDLAVRGNIDAPEAFLQLSRDRTIKGLMATRGLDLQWNESMLKIKGDFLLRDGSITLDANRKIDTSVMIRQAVYEKENDIVKFDGQVETKKTHIDFPPYLSLKGDFKSSPTRLLHKDNQLHLETSCQIDNSDIIFADDKHLAGNFSFRSLFFDYDAREIFLKTPIGTKDLVFAYRDKSLNGQAEANIKLFYNLKKETLKYSGDASFKRTELKGLPRFEMIQSIDGTINFENDRLETKGLRLKTRNTNIDITAGTLINFRDPLVEVQARAKNFHIDSWQDLIQKHVDKWQIDPSGLANVSIKYEGTIPYSPRSNILANAFLYDASLSGEKLAHDIKNISGTLKYDDGSIEWSDLKGTYKERDYLTSGTFINKGNPTLSTEILSEDMSLSGHLGKRGTTYKVDYLKGKFLQSSFDIKGDVILNNRQEPRFYVTGKLTVNLKNLPDLDPDLASYIYLANPLGVVAADASYEGSLKWREAAIGLNIKCPKISLYEMEFYNMNLIWEQEKNARGNFHLLTTFYDGAATLQGTIDVIDPDLPFDAIGQINKTNLSLLGKDLNWKKKDIAGLFSLGITTSGSLKNIRQVEGDGVLAIEQGHLGKTNLLKGVWGFLLIPEYENIVFTKGQSKFQIKDEKVDFRDLYLQSHQLDITGNGWIDFDQNINFDLTANFKESAIEQSNSLMKIPTQYLVQAAGFVGVRVGCTLTKPCHEKIIPKSKIIEKTTETLLEGVQGIFEGIFQ